MTDPVVVALDVGGTALKAGLVDPGGELCEERSVATATLGSGDRIVDGIRALAADVVADARAHHVEPAAVGLVVPGIVDADRGVGVSSMILGWRDVPFVDLLEGDLGLPVGFDHDVVAAARAEGGRGAARGARDWLYVGVGTGLGTAFFYRGEPYRGARGFGGELAHVVVDATGPLCRCGKRGCAEMIASGPAIADAYRRETGDDVDAETVAARAAAGDPTAWRTWATAVRGLAVAIAGHVESADPEVVVVGGGVARAGALLFDPLLAELRDRVRYAVPLVPVRPAAFGARSGLHGAALLARNAARHAVPDPGGPQP